jgi:ankyrin repeat protein
MTALHWAAERGDLRVAEVLIAAGASVEAGTRIGHYTPLHIAAKAGRPEVVAALIEAGVDVNVATTNSGATPLHLAASAGSADVIRLLVQHGADVNSGDGAAGQTPLMFAVAFNRVDAIRALLEAHADPAVTSKVIDLEALGERNEAMTHRFWELMVGFYGDEAGTVYSPAPSVLEAAIQASRQDDVAPPTEEEKEWLSDYARNKRPGRGRAQVSTSGGMTALLHAARAGNQEAAMVLLDAGADIEQRSAEGVSPLLMALINGRYDLALRLIERGADPTVAVDDSGLTPLYAVLNTEWIGKTFFAQPVVQEYQEATHYDVMRALLEAGVDPNARLTKDLWFNFNRYHPVDHTGATPFWRAAHGLDVEAMKMLVAHGANPSIATIHQKCRGGYGCRNGDDADEEEKDLSGVPAAVIGGPGVHAIHMATGFGYGLTYTGNEHRHMPNGWIPAVKYLIELGADVNARDYNAMTPLHNAAATGNNELILLLVEHGADVTVKNRVGQTVVDMANAPHDRVQPYPETIKLLESLGAEKSDVPPPCIARGSCG